MVLERLEFCAEKIDCTAHGPWLVTVMAYPIFIPMAYTTPKKTIKARLGLLGLLYVNNLMPHMQPSWFINF